MKIIFISISLIFFSTEVMAKVKESSLLQRQYETEQQTAQRLTQNANSLREQATKICSKEEVANIAMSIWRAQDHHLKNIQAPIIHVSSSANGVVTTQNVAPVAMAYTPMTVAGTAENDCDSATQKANKQAELAAQHTARADQLRQQVITARRGESSPPTEITGPPKEGCTLNNYRDIVFKYSLSAWSTECDLRHADLRGANLRDANLQQADLFHADLRHADLRGANLQDAKLSNTNLRGANLQGAKLQNVKIFNANLRGINLEGADLRGAKFNKVDLQGANLRGARLTTADLRHAVFTGADLTGAIVMAHQAKILQAQGITGFTVFKPVMPCEAKNFYTKAEALLHKYYPDNYLYDCSDDDGPSSMAGGSKSAQ